MNNKGIVIAGSAAILGAAIILLMIGVIWIFWKPLFFFGIGVAILGFGLLTIPKIAPPKQVLPAVGITALIGASLMIIALIPGAIPFSIGVNPNFDVTNALVSTTLPFEMEAIDQTICGDKFGWSSNPEMWRLTANINFHIENDFGEIVIIPMGQARAGRPKQDPLQTAIWEPAVFTGVPNISVSYDELTSFRGITGKTYNADVWITTICNGVSAAPSFKGNIEFWIDNEGCNLQEGTMVVAETFSAGNTVSRADLRFVPKAYCSQLPILVTAEGQIVEQKLEEYAILDKSFITIPPGQTWTFFYVIDITPDITVICDEGILNPDTGNCEVTPGIVHVCSVGIFDSEQALCIVQPEVRFVCELGFLDLATNQCVYIIPEDQTRIVCPSGSKIVVNDEGIEACIFEPDLEPVCSRGNYDPVTNTCKYLPETETILGFSLFQIAIVGILAVLVAIVGFVILTGGKR